MVYSSTIKDREIRIFGVGLRQLRHLLHILWDDTLLKRYKNPDIINAHIMLDTSFPIANRLENICEQIGKDIHENNRKIDVHFAGLLYHTNLILGKEYERCNYSGADPFVKWEELRKNRLHKGHVDGKEFFAAIKMFDPSVTIENVLPVPADDITRDQAQSFMGGLIELEGYGKHYGTMEVFICPGGQTFHKSNTTLPLDKSITLNNHPTHLIFYGSGKLGPLQNKIIEKYKALSTF